LFARVAERVLPASTFVISFIYSAPGAVKNVRFVSDSIEGLRGICKFIALDSPCYARIFSDKVFAC